ncbi:hypothetical protein H0E87_009812 [Populus deltoides]|uniref:Uncharacterized protein n=1 Tax=Populus deltoides TaxID=3696 RepID=A0A8T2YQI3_POPDE|nr:hypothetical protein H0E87_009812 [Populus deltoides]
MSWQRKLNEARVSAAALKASMRQNLAILESHLHNPETCGHCFMLELQTFKWEDYISWQRKLNEARVSAAALKASISGMSSEAKRPESKCKSFFRRSPLEDSQVVAKENKYDKGFFHNMFEALTQLYCFSHSHMVGHGLKGDQALWECLDHHIKLFIAIDQRIVGVLHCAVASGDS